MKTNEKNISLKEALQINHRAYKIFYRYYPKLILSQISLTIWKALTPYIIIYLSALVIEELAGDRSPDRIRFLVTITLLSGAGISLISAFLEKWKRIWSAGFGMKIKRILCEKLFDMDYCDLDDSKTMELYSSIIQNLNGPGWGLYNVLLNYESLCSEGISIICGFAMTISLFTSQVPKTAEKLVFLNNPVCVTAIISVMVLITWFSPVLAGKAGKYWARGADLHTFSNRLFAYYGHLGYDSKKAADMRIYQQEKICEKHNLSKENPFGSKGLFARYGKGPVGFYMAASSAVSVIFTGIAYIFVCLKAWAGAFGIGAVTKYISSVTKVYSSVSGCISTIEDMQNNAVFLKQTFEFLDISNNMYQGSLTTEKRSDRKYEIEFRNVSFRYPGCEQYALRNINMKFEIGQKLAVVGMNGSGKTTFIKLLCRLYDPTEGEILLNGIDIRKYNYKEYMMIFSVVFQDFKLFSLTLGENVAAKTNYDEQKVKDVLKKSAFCSRLSTMPEGLETYLYKDFSKNGVTISGGEAQKIAIARALYKNAPFIILDEPTAALDPIAEAEIYEKFNEIAGDKTAIYISHRLSSCKFCDKIVVFHEGAVIQTGTHQELVADKEGKYFQLWMAQAQYYV